MRVPWRRRSAGQTGVRPAGAPSADRTIVSHADWRRRRVRWPLLALQVLVLVFLVVVGLGPILWMLKSSITPTQDTLRLPMALLPHGFDLSQLSTAWSRTHIDRYVWNTVVIAFGSWAVQIVVATTAGFALSVLRPRFSRLLMGLVIATLFVPPIVLLVPLYLTIVDVPDRPLAADRQLLGDLAAGRRERHQHRPGEAVLRQPAARDLRGGPGRRRRPVPAVLVDRAADVAGRSWASSRCSRVIATWKDYLWPLLVIRNPDLQPLSVRLPTLQPTTDLGDLHRGADHRDASSRSCCSWSSSACSCAAPGSRGAHQGLRRGRSCPH